MNISNKDSGFILVSLLVTISLIMMLGVSALQLITSNLRTAQNEKLRLNSQLTADAGLDEAVKSLNDDQNWSGTLGEITLFDDGIFKTTYDVDVIEGVDSFQKFLSVEARTYYPSSDTTPTFTRKYDVEMRGVGGSSYSVVSGVGGLEMRNSAKIVGGEVYVNGTITMQNSAQIGLSSAPVSVNVAHQACPSPPDANYPTVCASGENGEPIDISNPARIYGEVKATNQVDGDRMSSPGLVAGNPTPAALPNHDRDAQVAAVADTMTGAEADCNGGTHTWAANTKIEGDVQLRGSCEVVVQGDIWITGELQMRNSSVMRVAPGMTEPPVIMVDGQNGVTIQNAGKLLGTTAVPPVGFRVITYYSNASCSPDCSNVTGVDLYDSKDITTISLQNSAEASSTEFYARWSKIEIQNSGNLGALVGQTVELTNSAAITFGATVSGFSAPSAWVVNSYKRVFD